MIFSAAKSFGCINLIPVEHNTIKRVKNGSGLYQLCIGGHRAVLMMRRAFRFLGKFLKQQ